MADHFKILIATDYSDTAKNAERYAIQLAESTNSTLVFLHVYQLPFNYPSEPGEFARSTEMLRKSEMKCLEQRCDELFSSLRISKSNLFYNYVVREGNNAGKEIAREAEESNSDFIIVGTHGANGFRKLFLGSRAWDVIKRSNKPVFAIPGEASFRGIRRIVFGIEYREGEIPGLNYVVHFARMFNAEVIALHITNYILTKRFEREMFEVFMNGIIRKINYPKLKVQLLVSENISEGVHKFCADHNVDLLVMSPEKSFLFEKHFMFSMSMTRKAVFHTHVPLMAIPDFYDSEHGRPFLQLTGTGEFVNTEK